MQTINNHKGLTFLEVVIAMAILSIISVAYLNLFTHGLTGIVAAGNRTDTVMSLQSIMSDLNAQKFVSKSAIESYATSKGYTVTVGNEKTVAGVKGFEVVMTGNIGNGTSKAQITTFCVKGGN
jgi:prepilin-type N-terminal cleavage/methylation domain-containing protein